MTRILAALALTAAMASLAFAQPSLRYYNTIPSSHAPAITSDPSPHGFAAGDFVARDPASRIDFELLPEPPDDR